MRYLFAVAMLCIATPSLAEIVVEDAYARIPRPNAPAGAVFFVIKNTGETDDRLIGATTEIAKKTELHTHLMDGDVMRMRPIEGGINVPAEGSHILERGGDHVMLMGLTEQLKEGDEITVILSFEHAGDVTITAPVDNTRSAGGHSGH